MTLNKSIEIMNSEDQREKKEKKIQNLRDLWNTIKHTNICIIVAQEGEQRYKGMSGKNV